ncbi:hypothetical protein BK126_12415 [Paenibacillus sp. FSL H7-0326]|nr:hypothetical protein BK126_12415 [Paenibacillus sp. FSL H7-0326]SDW56918.1 hypothetical protein SAMN05518848_102210 [Paenibacillus sp. PDC88]
MYNKINVACNGCDYFDKCHKVLVSGGEKIPAKLQDKVPMRCQNVVQNICRDCKWYLESKCASWFELNGKKTRQYLRTCPKKVTQS